MSFAQLHLPTWLGLAEWSAEWIGCSISLAGNHIPEAHLHYLEPVGNFAIALVLFNMGCHFPLTRFRRIIRQLLPISIGELAATMLLVSGGMYLLGMMLDDALLDWQMALLFGALALATAPATTVLVLLCVVFFVIHGAAMDLSKLWAAGAVGVAYITLRCSGKYLGVYFTADAHRDGPAVKRLLGSALLSQAGAAIALSAIAVHRDKALGVPLQDIILGTVVFFEIIGPILVRTAVLRGGEVPVAAAILHTTSSPIEQLHTMAYRMTKSLGISPPRGSQADRLDVNRVTRRNVKPLLASAHFDEVLDYIEHSHDNTYPVVSESNELIGIVRSTPNRRIHDARGLL